MKRKISFVKKLIIGAGLTGLSAAYHLKDDCRIFEQETFAGGTASSQEINGFIFDKTGHLLHFRSEWAKKMIDQLIGSHALEKHERFSWIFSKGIYTRYPFQANTYKLPAKVIEDCLIKMAQAQSAPQPRSPCDNLKTWILENFGEGIARHFMFPYNRKLWKYPLKTIGVDWANRFIPKTQLGSAIRGAISDSRKRFGYNRIFYYPRSGGIQILADAFLKKLRHRIILGTRVTCIDPREKIVFLNDGQRIKFDHLISTIPLCETIKMIKNPPHKILVHADQLKSVSVFNFNIGIDRPGISDKHWIYFPEKKYIFYRVGFFSNFSNINFPKKTSSLYTEISYRSDKPFRVSQKTIKLKIIKDLNQAGILRQQDNIIAEKAYDIKYAYPVSANHDSIKAILEFLKGHSIYSIGRYGSWRYMSMEECILEGKNTAEHLNHFDEEYHAKN